LEEGYKFNSKEKKRKEIWTDWAYIGLGVHRPPPIAGQATPDVGKNMKKLNSTS
jgi:hypothetical protein